MEINTNIIKYLIKEKNFKQTEIAEKLGVANAQISKWKLGGHIPLKREKELLNIAGLLWHIGETRLNSQWSVLVQSEENARNWYTFFKDCTKVTNSFDHLQRIRIAYDLYPTFDLYEDFLLVMNQAGIPIPEVAPEREPHAPDIEPDGFQIFVEDYLHTYYKLESWCCSNLPIGTRTTKGFGRAFRNSDIYKSMQDFFFNLPCHSMYKLIIENNPSFFPYGTDLFELNRYETWANQEYWGIRTSIEDTVHQNGLDFNVAIFDDLVDYPPEETISHLFDELPETLQRNNYDIVDGKLITAEDNDDGLDINLSYGERKIMESIKNNEQLLKELLEKINKL